MKSVLSAEDVSRWELCSRLPSLYSSYTGSWPVREAAKRAFYEGLSVRPAAPELMEAKFLTDAASAGYIYPSTADPYLCARDHGSWLSGAIHLASELDLHPVKRVPGCPVKVNAYEDSLGGIHLFRAVESVTTPFRLRWPEYTVAAYYHPALLTTHLVRLPRVTNDGRLHSPLSRGYRHPLTGNYRLARLDSDKAFSTQWIRRGRWEAEEVDGISWEEWRRGIDLDCCMEQCISHVDVPLPDPILLAGIRSDLDRAITESGQPVTTLPRKREMCAACIVRDVCHRPDSNGDDHGIRNNENEGVHPVLPAQAALPVSQ